jgi:hypothetical protein
MKNEEIAKVENENESKHLAINIEAGEFASLDEAEEFPVELLSDYWTPSKEGETKRMYFARFEEKAVVDKQTGEIKTLKTAYFVEPSKEGTAKVISNSSRRLVGALEDSGVKQGTALSITYAGKVRNKTNQFSSDNWVIKFLTPKR